MKIIEIFSSIQGEGPDVGLPTVFVRTAKCNLRCVWCDSEYTFAGGEEMSKEIVIQKALAFQLPAICLTGGEPTLQTEIVWVAEQFLAHQKQVSIFTNGTRPLQSLPREVRKVVDIKPPSALVGNRVKKAYLSCLDKKDVIKFVIRDENDFQWSIGIAKELGYLQEEGERLCRTQGAPSVWFSPSFGELEPVYIVNWIIRDKIEVRINMQLHKFIWNPEMRGV